MVESKAKDTDVKTRVQTKYQAPVSAENKWWLCGDLNPRKWGWSKDKYMQLSYMTTSVSLRIVPKWQNVWHFADMSEEK